MGTTPAFRSLRSRTAMFNAALAGLGLFATTPARAADVTSTWNGATNNWSTAANWANNPIGVVNFPNNGNGGFTYDAVVGSGNVTLDVNVTIHRLTLTGGTIGGNSNITMLQGFDWSGGTLTGTGVATLAAAATATFSGIANKDLSGGRTLNLLGNTTWTAGAIRTGGGALINNSGTFTANFDALLQNNLAGTATLNNSGLFQKTAGAGTATVSLQFNNSGTVIVNTGTLRFDGGGTHTGSLSAAAGAAFEFNAGVYNLNAGSVVSGAGTVVVSTTLNFNAGAFNPANLNLVSGTSTFAAPASATNLALNGGTLAGNGAFSVGSSLTWNGGTMTGTTTTTVPLGATATFATGANKDLSGTRILNLVGNTTWTAGAIRTGGGALINNSGTFTANFDALLQNNLAGTATLNNSGLFQKTAGAGTATVSLQFNNSGTVIVNTGTLRFDGGGTHTGAFSVAAGASLDFNSGAYAINGGSITGGGTVSSSANFAYNAGTYTPANTILVGGNATFAASVSIPHLTVTGATLTGPGTLTVTGAFDWSGGTLTGTGAITVSAGAAANFFGSANKDLTARTLNLAGNTTWSAGAIRTGSGAVINNSGTFTATFDGNQPNNLGGTSALNNSGLFQKTGGTGVTSIGSIFNNSGTVSVSVGTLSFTGGGTHTGQFVGAPGATADFSGGPHVFQAASSVTVPNVSFSGGPATFSGTYNPGAAGSTTFSGSTITFTNAANLLSLGNTTVSGGNATLSSGESPSANSLTVTSGTLGGSDNLTVNTTFNWTGGTITGTASSSVTLAPAATATIAGTANKDLTARTLNLAGNSTWSAGSIRTGSGAVINNSGTFTATFDGSQLNILGGTSALNNSGLLQKTGGTGVTSIESIFNNSGTVSVSVGRLTFTAGGTHTGRFTGAPGAAAVEFSGGSHNFQAASSVTVPNVFFTTSSIVGFNGTYNPGAASGSSTFASGTQTFNPAATVLSLGATLEVSGGTVTFNSGEPLAVNTFNLSAGAFGGSDNLTVNSALNWTGGTMSSSASTTLPLAATATLSGTANKDLSGGRTLNLVGNTTWSAGAFRTGNAVINNSGTITTDFDGSQSNNLGGTSTINNSGRFQKSGGTGATTVESVFNNTGTAAATVGILSFTGGGSGNGVFTAATGATIRFAGGNHTAARAVGQGALAVTLGAATFTDDYNVDNTLLTGGTLAMSNGPGAAQRALRTRSLSLATNNARLDLGNNALVVDYDPAGPSPLAAVRTAIRAGYNPAAATHWTSTGIISAAAAANPSTALAYGEATTILGISGTQTAAFAGQTVDASAVLVRYALFGDANLDGAVNFADLVNLAQNYNTTVSAATDDWWSHGDFTYDGLTNFADLVALAQNYNTSLAAEPIPGASPDFNQDLARALATVPEPDALALLALSACGLAVKRRRRRK